MVTGGTGAKMRVCSKVNSKINSLQGLRFVACICVFGAHTAIKELTPFLGGASGVMFFLVLSGFLESYNHISYKQKNWNRTRISGLVTMSFFSTFSAFLLWLIQGYSLDRETLVALVVSLFLLQSWFPGIKYFYTFSSVSWFVGNLIFCYLLTPILLEMIRRIPNKLKALMFVITGKLLFESMIIILFEGQLEHYFIYIFPPFRLLDYVCGLFLGALFIDKSQNIDRNKKVNGTKEVIAILCFFLVTILSGNLLAFQWGMLLLIPTMMLIYIFAFEDGFLSCFFAKRAFQFLGNRSGYYFIFHFMILQYTRYLIENLVTGAVIAVVLTICITEIYIWIKAGIRRI